MSSQPLRPTKTVVLPLLLGLLVLQQPSSRVVESFTTTVAPVRTATTTAVTGASSSSSTKKTKTALKVSIGLGPEKDQKETKDLVAGVDYEVPDHEQYRTSRRSKIDEACDAWFEALLNGPPDEGAAVVGEDVVEEIRSRLTTPVELVNEVEKPYEHEDWTPYVSTKLPCGPLTPAYGLEQFGLPVPRRNAEMWRHFDVAGMVSQDYSAVAAAPIPTTDLDDATLTKYRAKLRERGAWLDDDKCTARLVYVDGRFVPQLSKQADGVAQNVDGTSGLPDEEEFRTYLSRLTDGFTDELVVPVSNGEFDQTRLSKLSSPNHNVGDPTSQFAINTQQGTACFAALNTLKTKSVAYVRGAPREEEADDDEPLPPPVLVVNAVTPSGGLASSEGEQGTACHPRTVVVVEKSARLSVVQSCVDFDVDGDNDSSSSGHAPKLFNGYTQFFVKEGANVTHSYLQETGGIVTPGVEGSTDQAAKARETESQRPELKDTHLEAIDVHVLGEGGSYKGTVMNIGGNGRVRLAMSVSLLQPNAFAEVNGFCMSGGAQRADVKTNILHVAQGTTSRQNQKNMIGGRSTGAFRGRIRVEQSAQQTDSQQLSRSVLLSDKARAWAVPSLEIIADDVKCTHGSTVSDLSEEELFYLRSRGLGRSMARNLLMYAFAGDVCTCVDPSMLGSVDSNQGLQQRVIQRLENLVPQGERAVRGEFQSI